MMKLARVEAAAVSLAGWLLLCELAAAVRWNVTFLHHDVVFDPRFSLYLWTAVGLALLVIMRGLAAGTSKTPATWVFVFAEAPLTLLVAVLAIIVARGWRIATDSLAPGVVSLDEALPVVVVLLARPMVFWTAAIIIGTLLVHAFWRAYRSRLVDGS